MPVTPTWDDLDPDPDTGDSIPDAFLELEGRTLALRTCHFGPTAPDDPTEGWLWLDSSTDPYRLWIYTKVDGGSPDWQPLGPLNRLPGSINADPSLTDTRAAAYEYKALRVENRASLPAAAGGNSGLLVHKTGDGELYHADQPVAGAWKGLLSIVPGVSYDTQELALEGSVGNDATNPPTLATKGTLTGWLFDATNEKRTFAFVVPKNWQGASDLAFRLHQVLNGAQTASDVIEWSGEVRVLPIGTAKVTKTATALVNASTNIGSNANGIDEGGGPHVTSLVIDHDDATNPVSVGALVLVTVNRTTVSGAGKVAGTIVFRADLAYAQRPRHERA